MRTAVAAPDAFDDLFAFMDRMTLLELLRFNLRLHYLLLGKLFEGSGL